ncbi:MAG: DNA repair protein RecN [Clostridiales bacterium]|nr:DNA repair protein RecN [Clostridiales bacterium]MDY4173322.1 DNA repair protein RecN [Evtepia sp.]
MLSLLHIENIALIDRADISFGPGFNVLTGETGAGKSIIIDAISAVMGERTSRDLIRTGEKSALVTALFRDLPPLPWFEETGVGPDENGELLLSRKIQGDGKNICRVGGVPCTVVQLKALGGQLIDIHGQHDGQQLLDETCHLGYLDSFGALNGEWEAYHKEYTKLDTLRKQIASLQMDEAEKARRVDILQFQIAELERAALRPGEEEELEERKTMLRSADQLVAAVEGAYNAIFGDDSRDGAASLLAEAGSELSRVADFSGELAQLSETVSELRYTAEDAAERLRDLRETFDFSPKELDEVEGRLDQLHRLKKKYGASVQEMLDYLARSKEELDQIEMADDTLLKLRKQRKEQLAKTREKGELLSQKRREAAQRLKARIEQELRQLDMPKVCFQAEFAPKPGKLGLDETGMDEVRFLMSANVGENLKPIAKVASGGELSRIMLALKNVLAENDNIMTLIFDEVDTGVSGRAAGKVAEKMSRLSQNCQVLCVTHLPQIAAMADSHYSVHKEEKEGRTYTNVEDLDRQGRKEELARLTGGAHLSAAILEGAEELLREADAYKKTR